MRRITSILFIICSAAVMTNAQEENYAFLEQLQPRDSILVADQLRYGFELKEVKDGSGLALPELGDTLSAQLPIIQNWKVDTLKNHKRKHCKDLKISFVTAPFDEGEYHLPDLPAVLVSPDGVADTLVFKGVTIKVCAPDIDMENYEICDIKEQMKYPITFTEVLPWLGGALLLAALIIATVIFIKKRRAKREEELRHDPPHIVALRKLDAYRGDKFWAPAKQKLFYTGVTDALREYIVSRYGVGAMEMTTAEIFKELKDSDMPEDIKKELRELFERSDYVKFAKYVASDEENAQVLPISVKFVTSTYQEEITEESKEAGNVL